MRYLALFTFLFLFSCPAEEFPSFKYEGDDQAADYKVVTSSGEDLMFTRADVVKPRNRVWISFDSVSVTLNGTLVDTSDLTKYLNYLINNPDELPYLPETPDSVVLLMSIQPDLALNASSEMIEQAKRINTSLYWATLGAANDDELPKIRIGGYDPVREDKSILAKLPPWSDEEPDLHRLKPRNVLEVVVNADNEVLVRGAPEEVLHLTERAKQFIMNPEGKEDLAASPTQAIISLKNDRRTSYAVYLEVYNALKRAYEELWEEKSQELYGQPYSEALTDEQLKTIKNAIPMVISEAEPTDLGE